jgi:hypothetical protein
MNFEIKPLSELPDYLPSLLQSEFKFDEMRAATCIKGVNAFISKFLPGIYVGIESQYVDKLYRNAYYNYYSSKLNIYPRDCIRLSFFIEVISLDDFQSAEGAAKLQDAYRGFIIIRPTFSNLIGRNVLHPALFKKEYPHLATVANFQTSINGIKLSVDGFPHSSQDSEFMVCAETTIWSVMEYFSTRYPDYVPILPKKIHSVLANTSMERQVPSSGLTGLQMSYAFKELGFGVKLYTRQTNGEATVMDIIRMYVESGIPVVTVIRNDKGIGHVLTIVGRSEFVSDVSTNPIKTLHGGSQVFDYYSREARYLVVDDNLAPYSTISLDDPACNYANEQWKDCKIIAAIVPLHNRIYMEADRAKKLALYSLNSFDSQEKVKLPNLTLRVLLSSSRSFKQSIALNPDLDTVHKTAIVNMNMPKFVWIAEVGTTESFKAGKATGMMLMDATEPKKTEILAYFLENMYIGRSNGVVSSYSLPLRPFSIHHNLKSY